MKPTETAETHTHLQDLCPGADTNAMCGWAISDLMDEDARLVAANDLQLAQQRFPLEGQSLSSAGDAYGLRTRTHEERRSWHPGHAVQEDEEERGEEDREVMEKQKRTGEQWKYEEEGRRQETIWE